MAFLLAARPFFQEFKDKKSLMGGGGVRIVVLTQALTTMRITFLLLNIFAKTKQFKKILSSLINLRCPFNSHIQLLFC